MDNRALGDRVASVRVSAPTTPRHKTRIVIVSAFQSRGEVVAVTWDGGAFHFDPSRPTDNVADDPIPTESKSHRLVGPWLTIQGLCSRYRVSRMIMCIWIWNDIPYLATIVLGDAWLNGALGRELSFVRKRAQYQYMRYIEVEFQEDPVLAT
ncbi:hypothetical protein FRC12_024960 [Ceratobasidium sp. 428]|nr:hypothetical protein FRC12_024960 [Ceratobasidium sp. 428]